MGRDERGALGSDRYGYVDKTPRGGSLSVSAMERGRAQYGPAADMQALKDFGSGKRGSCGMQINASLSLTKHHRKT
ncbi:hypothetical protein WBP06_04195 [Novosphingobium sp. BL-8H]|uniref:hypothetical protein n=1 Tax=Novosphingobium sp. BL-8H TaxID=3127640 RepID=UPI0037564FDA